MRDGILQAPWSGMLITSAHESEIGGDQMDEKV